MLYSQKSYKKTIVFFMSQKSENMRLKKLFILFCSIEANSRIMELDPNDGSLKVHYSDRLVILLREVRQLSALGFVIPAKIQQVANIAQKFCKQAIILKQVWNYIFKHMAILSSSHQNILIIWKLTFLSICLHAPIWSFWLENSKSLFNSILKIYFLCLPLIKCSLFCVQCANHSSLNKSLFFFLDYLDLKGQEQYLVYLAFH